MSMEPLHFKIVEHINFGNGVVFLMVYVIVCTSLMERCKINSRLP